MAEWQHSHDRLKPSLSRRCLAEGIGTFALVFAGTGAIVVDGTTNGEVTHVGVSLVFGLVVAAMIYTLGDVSGAHINPAVTLCFWGARRFPGSEVIPYAVAQCVGAIVASVSIRALFPADETLGATVPAGAWSQAFGLEVVLTFLLALVILNVSAGAKEKGVMAGVAIGGVVAFEALFGGPISGASMNPARSLAPALVSGNLSDVCIYLAAPTVGALLAVPVARLVSPAAETTILPTRPNSALEGER